MVISVGCGQGHANLFQGLSNDTLTCPKCPKLSNIALDAGPHGGERECRGYLVLSHMTVRQSGKQADNRKSINTLVWGE